MLASMDLEQLRTSKAMTFSSVEVGPHCAENEQRTREEAGNTSSDTGLGTSDQAGEAGQSGHQQDRVMDPST